MTSTSQDYLQSNTRLDEATHRFTLWALATLKLRVESEDQRVFTLHVPEEQRSSFGGASTVRFTFDLLESEGPEPVERIVPGSRLLQWLIQRLRGMGEVVEAVPKYQPVSVHQISRQLFSPYTVDGGTVHLAGCRLEDYPLLRLTYRIGGAAGQLRHLVVRQDGTVVDQAFYDALLLDELAPLSGRVPKLESAELRRWLEAGRRAADQRLADELSDGGPAELLVAARVWCKYVEGKLSFVIGLQGVEIPFGGWAQLFADGSLQPPPYTCPWTGKQAYHLVAADDGRITVAHAVAACSESGRRVVESDLQTCVATGNRALPEYFELCPVSGVQVIRSSLAPCSMCRQVVSPAAMESDHCAACRSLATVSKHDPRMARLLGQFPKLDRWRRWKIAETSKAYILTATALLHRLLLVFDKHTLQPLYLATGGRLRSRWSELTDHQREELLH